VIEQNAMKKYELACLIIGKKNTIDTLVPITQTGFYTIKQPKSAEAPDFPFIHAVYKNGKKINKIFETADEMNDHLYSEYDFHSTELKD